MPYLISCRDDVRRLLTDQSIAHRYDQVELSMLEPPSSPLLNHVKSINKYYFSCGCNIGAISMLSALVTSISIITWLDSWSITSLLLLIPLAFFSGLIGKLIGLAHAKWKSNKHLNQLLTIL